MPEAEAHFFNDDKAYEKGQDFYEDQLDPGENGLKIGEKTPTYSYLRKVPGRIHRHYPDTQIIWIFRDPVARAYSNYWHAVKKGSELRSWPRAVEDEIHGRTENRWKMYLKRSDYVDQIRNYLQYWRRDEMIYLLFEEFIENPAEIISSLYRSLGVEPSHQPAPQHRNKTYLPRSRLLQHAISRFPIPRLARRAFRKLNRRNEPGYPPMDPDLERNLRLRLTEKNQAFEELTGLDTSSWKPG